MSAAARKQRLRERSEQELRLAAMEDLRRRYPDSTTDSAIPRGGPFWRVFFVPLYRHVPWRFKRWAMRRLRMTSSGWPQDAHRFQPPWRYSPGTGDGNGPRHGGPST
jgi:hypothetical protein